MLDAMNTLTDFNKRAGVEERKRFTEFFPEQEYDYELLPMRMAKRDRPLVYLKRGSTIKTINRLQSVLQDASHQVPRAFHLRYLLYF
ncbi:hypothetical protein K523DRAFT_326368, partial [Schizophyllum commune Tattone D]